MITIVICVVINYWPSSDENNEVASHYTRYRFVYTLALNSSIAGEVQINCTIPTNSPDFQDIQSVNYSVNPSWTIADDHDNEIAHFSLNLAQVEASELSITILVELNKTSYTIPSYSTPYDNASSIFQEYTKPEKYVESNNPMIIEVARNITNGCSDPLNASRIICTWVNQYLNYSGFSASTRGALWALTNKNGDCTEYSDLFVALCRAHGIPARFIDGVDLSSVNTWGVQSWEKIGHDWAEVYLQNIGWVWVDPTSDQFSCSDGQHMAIQLGQYSSSLAGWYRYSFTGNAIVTEQFCFYPQA